MNITDEMLRQSAREAARIYDRALVERDEPVLFSERFEKKMRPLLRGRKVRKIRRRQWMSLAACLGVVCLFGLTGPGQALLQGVFQRVTTMYSGGAEVAYTPELSSGGEEDSGDGGTLAAALPDSGEKEFDDAESATTGTTADADEEGFTRKEPTELAAGLELADSYDDDYLRVRQYEGDDGASVYFEQEYAGGTVYRYSLEDTEAETVTIGDDEQAYCISDDDGYTLLWIDGTSRMQLIGQNISRQELLDMANSVG